MRGLLSDLPFFFLACAVYQYMQNDFEVNFRNDLPYLIQNGVRVTIYEGVEDLICNFYGASATLATLNWPGANGFNNAANRTWTVGSQKAGSIRSFGNLTYVTVNAAGHMVIMRKNPSRLFKLTISQVPHDQVRPFVVSLIFYFILIFFRPARCCFGFAYSLHGKQLLKDSFHSQSSVLGQFGGKKVFAFPFSWLY